MKYERESATLNFRSQAEVEAFHAELSGLVRAAMIQATKAVEDPKAAVELSRAVMKDYRAVLRALNALWRGLARKTF